MPNKVESDVLRSVLADVQPDGTTCVRRTAFRTDGFFWPHSLSFGDGRRAYAGNASFDEMKTLSNRLKPLRRASLMMPDQIFRNGTRVIGSAEQPPSCRERLTLSAPLFDGVFAVVAIDEQIADIAGGSTNVYILRLERGRWQRYAYGRSDWGRPVI